MLKYEIGGYTPQRRAIDALCEAALLIEDKNDLWCKHIHCSECCFKRIANHGCGLTAYTEGGIETSQLTDEHKQHIVNLVLFGNSPHWKGEGK